MAELTIAGASCRIEGILFDKDGTLMDFIHTWGHWGDCLLARFSGLLEERGLSPLPMKDSLLGTIGAEHGEIIDYDRNGPLAMGTIEEQIAILTWQGYQAGLSWAEAKEMVYASKSYADRSLNEARQARLLPDLVPFLKKCRTNGLKLAVVTADDTEPAIRHLEWLGIRDYFSACVGNDVVGRGKPFPDMAELACRELGLSCSQVAVIGDTNGDMRMAKAAGAAAAIGITACDAISARELLPAADWTITSYRELAIRGEAG
ncbi:HAD family hydrolase [Paenibacillus sp. NPDC058071]|uniref:HAD family hydrolase n=1 Tax=Paenibacillus sp. NPDC058071 TaxID=3346326 RepID=UPI0036D7BDC3